MEKLEWYSLQELGSLQSIALVKCYGRVKSIENKHNYYSFLISDGLNEAEATIYEDQRIYSILDLPQKNQIAIVIGQMHKRELANKNSIVKIKVKVFKTQSGESVQARLKKRVQQSQKQRQSSQLMTGISTKTKRSLIKDLKTAVDPVQMRSLILGCVYITLQNNQDLSSYTFSMYTIQKHRLTKSYIQSKKLKQQSIQYLLEFIDAQLRYLIEKKLIQEKEMLEGQRIYKVERKIFTQLEMRILGVINEKAKTGTVLSDIVNILNREQGLLTQKNYVYNDNFVQKMLKKFIDDSRIYKTSEKVLYPNS